MKKLILSALLLTSVQAQSKAQSREIPHCPTSGGSSVERTFRLEIRSARSIKMQIPCLPVHSLLKLQVSQGQLRVVGFDDHVPGGIHQVQGKCVCGSSGCGIEA
jgi:hypothetical protein